MNKGQSKILLVEDDPNLGTLLIDYLRSEGFDSLLCKNGEQALDMFNSVAFDLCLVDVMLPKMDGFTLVKEIRKKNKKIPIIFISAKSLKVDKLMGYGLGADDYVTKPFDEEELLWKIKAAIRRNHFAAVENPDTVISIGKYILDFQNQLLSIGSSSRRITEKEGAILKYLADRRNNVVKREDLLKDLWGENDYFLGRSLDVFITKIRKYLKEDITLSIENVFGVGFVLKTD